jgi:hypothetical protein
MAQTPFREALLKILLWEDGSCSQSHYIIERLRALVVGETDPLADTVRRALVGIASDCVEQRAVIKRLVDALPQDG